ncbi:MAG: hypothetical protein ACRD3D_15345 [Terriglobia bacterium]
MPMRVHPACSSTVWQGREAFALENGLVRVVALASGGHVAEFRFLSSTGLPATNPLWTPPWKTIDHDRYEEKHHKSKYGAPETGKLLCGIAGHNICLDYFGVPSPEEAKRGLAIHGEAPSARWKREKCAASPLRAALAMSARLPAAGLRFRREISLRRGETVVGFRETVSNERNADHLFHWTQHVTLGPPFLNLKEARVALSARRGRTFPHGYEGSELLAESRDFRWPLAPGVDGGQVDLSRPFLKPGLGFIATALMDPRREVQFIAAINHRLRLVIGYCFSRNDFPWTAIWEENRARGAAPWRKRTRARGLEFGSTPFPVGRREAFANGPLFGAPHFSLVSARGRKTVRYLAFLASVPSGFGEIADVRVDGDKIRIRGSGGEITVAASGAEHLGGVASRSG